MSIRTHAAQDASPFTAAALSVFLAGRVRALGSAAPDGLAQLLGPSTLKPRLGVMDSMAATLTLAADHAAMARHAHDAAEDMEQAHDSASHEIFVARIPAHDKAAWLLGSHCTPQATLEAGAPSC